MEIIHISNSSQEEFSTQSLEICIIDHASKKKCIPRKSLQSLIKLQRLKNKKNVNFIAWIKSYGCYSTNGLFEQKDLNEEMVLSGFPGKATLAHSRSVKISQPKIAKKIALSNVGWKSHLD